MKKSFIKISVLLSGNQIMKRVTKFVYLRYKNGTKLDEREEGNGRK